MAKKKTPRKPPVERPVQHQFVGLQNAKQMLRTLVEHTLARKGMTFRLAVETDTLTLCLDLARRGVGHTVVPACAVHAHVTGQSICWSPVRGLNMTWALCENQGRMHSQAVREGRRLVFETVRFPI